MAVNHGSKRIVTGAHYGLRDWLAQRVTAAIMVVFTLALLGGLLGVRGTPAGSYLATWFGSVWTAVFAVAAGIFLLWLSWKKVSIALLAIFTFSVILQILLANGSIGYDQWSGIFAAQWMKVLTFTVIIALCWHIWVGMRDIWMDYVTSSVALRLVLQIFTMVWLVGCAGWAIQVLWRL